MGVIAHVDQVADFVEQLVEFVIQLTHPRQILGRYDARGQFVDSFRQRIFSLRFRGVVALHFGQSMLQSPEQLELVFAQRLARGKFVHGCANTQKVVHCVTQILDGIRASLRVLGIIAIFSQLVSLEKFIKRKHLAQKRVLERVDVDPSRSYHGLFAIVCIQLR